MVAILLHRRSIQHLDLRLLRLLLRQPPSHHWRGEHDALLLLQLPGLSGLWAVDWHDRLLDRLCVREEDIWRYQGRLSVPEQAVSEFYPSKRRDAAESSASIITINHRRHRQPASRAMDRL